MDYQGFGSYLVQQRELRGMDRAEVARATKISEAMLGALESGRLEQLPGRVFILNYIRAYAQVIGISPDDAVLRFEEIDKTVKSSPPPPALERERKKHAAGKLAVVLAISAVIVAILLALFLRQGEGR